MNLAAAQEFALDRHGDQAYGVHPYRYHLDAVAQILLDAGFGPESFFVIAAWLHDVVEDTDTKIGEVRTRFGVFVSKLVWAVTGEGQNRKARNADQYRKINKFPPAAIPKTADRIGNMESCIAQDTRRLLQTYVDEAETFRSEVVAHLPRTPEGDYLLDRFERAVTAAKTYLSRVGDA